MQFKFTLVESEQPMAEHLLGLLRSALNLMKHHFLDLTSTYWYVEGLHGTHLAQEHPATV